MKQPPPRADSGKWSIRTTALRGAAAELGGYASGMVTRLVSTLVLSRLLFPEAFGQSALIGVTMQGLVMLSDVGLHQSVVQNPRGEDPDFLDTVWTMQAVRGVVLWLLACLIAWPMAVLYDEPPLAWLVPVGALAVLVGGLTSTSFVQMRRRLEVWRLMRIEILAQVVTVTVTCLWAWLQPTVWALIGGSVFGALFRVIQSHAVSERRNRFHWDESSRAEIVHFGKWIFASSSLAFLSRQGDRMMMAYFIGMGSLGIYSIAYALSDAVASAVMRVSHGVLFPLFSQLHRESDERLHRAYYRIRLRTDAAALIPIGALAVLAQPLVNLMYDPRYHEAGWILSALCVKVAMNAIVVPVETYMFSTGNPRSGLYENIGRSVWMLFGIPLAWHAAGLEGIVWLVAFSEIPGLAIMWWNFRRLGLLRLRKELFALLFLAAGLLIGLVLRWLWYLIPPLT